MRGFDVPERFPITWNHVIDKESLKFKMVERVLIEKSVNFFEPALSRHGLITGAK